MKSAFTVDLEDWFCSHNLKDVINYNDWGKLESRVVANTLVLIDLLNRNKVKATFFTLGWVAERFPELVKIIDDEGHEIASHGYAHQQVTSLTREEFATDIIRAKNTLEQIIHKPVKGYRAPAFSITKKTSWALGILEEQGFSYDSSIYPISFHPDYGNIDTPLEMHYINRLLEIPLSCTGPGRLRIPCSGGAYLRFYPLSFFKYLAKKVIAERPFVFYIHPWEIDKNPPRVALKFSKHFRHYYNTGSTLKKMEHLLKEIEFTSIENIIHDAHPAI